MYSKKSKTKRATVLKQEAIKLTVRGWIIPPTKDTTLVTQLQLMKHVGSQLKIRYNRRTNEWVLHVPHGIEPPPKLIEMMQLAGLPEQTIKLNRSA